MLELLLPYLAGPVALVLCMMISATAYLHAKRKEHAARVLESRLPEACHYEDLMQRVSAAEQSIAALSDELARAKATIARKDEAEAWLAQNAQRYEELRQLMPDLSARVEAAQNELAGLVEQRIQMQKELSEAEARRTWLKEEIVRATDSYDKATADVQKARLQVDELAAREASLKVSLAEVQQRLQHREQQLQQTETDLAKAEAALRDIQGQLESKLNEHRRLEHELRELMEARDEARKELKQLEEACEAAAERASKAAQMAKDAELRTQSLEKRCKEAEGKFQEAKSELEQLQKRAAEEQNKASQKLEAINKELGDARKQRDAALAERERLTAEVQESKTRLSNLEDFAKKVTSQLDKMAQVSGATEEQRLAELWSPLLHPHSGTPSDDEEEAAIERVSDYLQGHRLRFPRRIVNAFHTAMKVQDMSPICVLAGISGTGKSELPRRYAEAMGMHFLNVPVQPRWDSPQDMFGFFNYMEGRYRATELARALVQMDPYGGRNTRRGWDCDEEWINEQCRAEEMLVVLLDEMNLARVEYYFSELLSKLETRRGVDMAVAQQREKAEVVLDVGLRLATQMQGNQPQVIAQPTLRLFVDTNVLFVGTMNEDESTQTLSDKVMDRANVLRFGKPSKLKVDSNGDLPEAPGVFIEYGQWKTWVRTADELDGRDEQLDSWIGRLNEALNRIHKPFAFRTDKAIRTYVANYPGAIDDDEMLGWAMSDQIEMKVFPKLRGLDLADRDVQNAVQAIGGVLHDLGDKPLEAAFREATGRDRHQFIWQGIERQDAE